MRKLGVVAGVLAALTLMPAVATATTSSTFHINGVPIDVGPAVCVAGDLVLTGNGVEHQTVDNAGDVWITATLTGSATVSDPSSGFTGRATAWFGLDENARNFTTQFIADAVGTLGNGTPLKIHQVGTFTLNAQGVPVVNNTSVTCS